VLLCKKRVALLALPFVSVPVAWASTLVPRHHKTQGYPSPICNLLFCYIWQGLHMSFDVYNQNSLRFFNIQGSIEKASEWYSLEGNMQYFLKD
jgi:hypothetical protein